MHSASLVIRALAAVGWALVACGCDREGAGNERVAPGPPPRVAAVDPGEPWWREAVFYEIFVRSFADSRRGPLAGDGIGDLSGLVERLDYLNDGDPAGGDDLGVDALWLMPVCRSPSYHGYDVVDYTRIEEDYGTNDDFRRLVAEAHRRGIRVIVDLVLNHTSDRHPWFLDAWRRRSPFHDHYIWSHEARSYRGPWGQPVWHQLDWWQRGWKHFDHYAYYGIFSPRMPDLNHRSPAVKQAMFDVARFWLEEMGADGFRLDAARHLIEEGAVQQDTAATHAWLRDFHRHVHAFAPEAVVVGEVWADTATVAGYGADELDLAFQFALAAETVAATRSGDAERLRRERRAVRRVYGGRPYATFLTNHDQVRVMSELGGEPARARLAATLLLTSPGAPFLYYGEEIGMVGHKPDPQLRRPMQWSAERNAGFSRRRPWQRPNPDYPTVNVARQTADGGSLLSHYRRLLRLRRAHPALRRGELVPVATANPAVDAYLRRDGDERILVLVNLGERPVADYELTVEGGWGGGGRPEELLADPPRAAAPPPAVGGYRPLAELAPLDAWLLRWSGAPGGELAG